LLTENVAKTLYIGPGRFREKSAQPNPISLFYEKVSPTLSNFMIFKDQRKKRGFGSSQIICPNFYNRVSDWAAQFLFGQVNLINGLS